MAFGRTLSVATFVYAQNVPVSASASITYASAVKPADASQQTSSHAAGIALGVSLLAALGLGSIIAAVISRWNAISQLRQAWVDALRKEIADYFLAVERVGESFSGPPEIRRELRPRRDHAMYVHRQILLRLNMSERDHRHLDRRLTALLLTGGAADLKQVDLALSAARRVLKREWERTKYGPLMRVARRKKRWVRYRSLTRSQRSLWRRMHNAQHPRNK